MSETKQKTFKPVSIAVLTVSDTRNDEQDKSGHLLVNRLQEAGHKLADKTIVKDDIYAIRAIVSQWIFDEDVNCVLITGGTGITGRDGTPEAVSVLFDKTIEGFGEAFRMLSFDDIKTSSLQSRAIAGVANATFIFSLPGSVGACAMGWDKIIQFQLDYSHKPCNLVQLMPRLREK